jgi:hypothetical protein
MKIGDFVLSHYGPIGSYENIVKIIGYEGVVPRITAVSANPNDRQYLNLYIRDVRSWTISDRTKLEPLTLEALGRILKSHILREDVKEEFSAFVKQMLIDRFGEPPKKVVEAEYDLGSTNILMATRENLENIGRPLVEEGQVSGFIRVNRG